MPDNNTARKPTRKVFNSARHAATWLTRGIYPVPLEKGTKRPKGEKNGSAKGANGWTKLRLTEETIPDHFNNEDNIGGLWGEPSAWAVDIDLDTVEAQNVAPYFLPETLVYGRHQAPHSHYIYHCRNAQTMKFHTKEVGMIVEIRSTGSQSVLPPSVHPTGDRYRIDHDVDIADIGWGELKKVVSRVAAAAISAHYYPEAGSRHDYVHATTGCLLHAKWPEAEVRNFMEAVRSGAEDEESADRDGTINNTIKSFQNGGNVQGFPSLSQFMPALDLQNLKRYLGLDKVIPDNDVAPDSVSAEPVLGISDRLLDVGGLVGRIAKWASQRGFTKQPIFDLAVGLMATAMATKNKYRIEGLNTPLQPYMMLVAPTAGGKEAAMDSTYYLARKMGLRDSVFSKFQSYHAMLDIVAAHPHIALWIWDEAARQLKTAGKSSASQEYQVLTHLLSLYGKAGSLTPGVPARKNAIPALDYPFFCVMASAQPEQLLEAVSSSDMAEGMVNRFLLFDSGTAFARDNEERQDIFPTALETAFKEFDKVKLAEGVFKDIGYETKEAWEILSDYRTFARETGSKSERGSQTWGRANQNALILAGLVTVGLDPINPRISEKTAQWATEFATWSVERWLARIDQSSSRSFTEANSKFIERLIRTIRNHRFEALNNKPELALIDKGLTPRSLLVRKCRHLKLKDVDDVLTHLMLSDLIGSGEVNDRDCYWPKASRQPGQRP